MGSYDEKVGEPQVTDKAYTDIIRSDVAKDPRFTGETGQPAKIAYYCQDCKKLVPPKRVGNKFVFSCQACKKDVIAFGTEKSLGNYYRIPGMKAGADPKKLDL